MVPRVSSQLRKAISEVNPGPKLTIDVVNDATGETEVVTVEIRETFFRTSEDV